jgi:hypothetical protein
MLGFVCVVLADPCEIRVNAVRHHICHEVIGYVSPFYMCVAQIIFSKADNNISID